MVTAGHVAAAMGLSNQKWTQVEILDGQSTQSIDVRIMRLAGAHAEKIAVLELRTAFPGAQGLQIRIEPLAPEERVVSLAYPGNRLRFVGGQFVSMAMATSSRARRCLRCTTETTGSSLIMALQARRYWIARAAWLRSSATSSPKHCSFRRARYGSQQLGEAPTSFLCQVRS